jgi:hypothetical protein
MHGAQQIGADDAGPVVHRVTVEPGTGDVEHVLQAVKLPDGAVQQCHDLLFIRHIAAMRQRRRSRAAQAGRNLAGKRIVDVGDHDAGAHRGAQPRNGRTGPRASARDQRDPPLEQARSIRGAFHAASLGKRAQPVHHGRPL